MQARSPGTPTGFHQTGLRDQRDMPILLFLSIRLHYKQLRTRMSYRTILLDVSDASFLEHISVFIRKLLVLFGIFTVLLIFSFDTEFEP